MDFHPIGEFAQSLPENYVELTEGNLSNYNVKEIFQFGRTNKCVIYKRGYPQRIVISFTGVPEILSICQLETRLQQSN